MNKRFDELINRILPKENISLFLGTMYYVFEVSGLQINIQGGPDITCQKKSSNR
jgi:hypothetical protein